MSGTAPSPQLTHLRELGAGHFTRRDPEHAMLRMLMEASSLDLTEQAVTCQGVMKADLVPPKCSKCFE